MQIDVRHNFPAVQAALREDAKQVPFAASVALNETAGDVTMEEQRVMGSVFDRPTPFTLGSLFVQRSTKTTLQATVRPKDAGAGGRSASLWLDTEVAGGPRREKGFERALRAAGVLPAGMYAVPAAAAQLDAFGNWRRAELTRVLVDMRLAATTAAARRIDRLKAKAKQTSRQRRSRYFMVSQAEGELEPGIYERQRLGFGEGIRPIVIFVPSAPRYKRRLPFEQVAQRIVARSFPRRFDEAYARARATARPVGGAR